MKPNTPKSQPRRLLSLLGTATLAAGMIYMTGCRQQMADQPYYSPLEGSAFFKDGAASRPLIEGTVSRSTVMNKAFATGKVGDKEVTGMPFPVTAEMMARGRQRFNIYCAPCHGQAGDGQSVVGTRFIVKPPSYHQDRLRKAPIGHFVNVIANGFGSMYNYSARVAPADRWAIAAYIRALQLSQQAAAPTQPVASGASLTPTDSTTPTSASDSTASDSQGSAQ